MDKTLSYVGTGGVDSLNILRSHVFTVGQLEDLFLVVNDLQSPIRLPLSNITCVKPTIAVKNVGRHLGIPGAVIRVSCEVSCD